MKFRGAKNMHNNFGEFFNDLATRKGGNTAFIIKNKKGGKVAYTNITYKKLEEDIKAFASALINRGLKGKRVAHIGKNCYEWFITMAGTIYAGASSVPLDRGLTEAEILDQTGRINADAFVFGADYKETAEKMNTLKICFEPCEEYETVADLINEGYEKGLSEDNCVSGDDVSFYLFTSGTTSKSKIVMLSQKNILSNIYDMQQVEDLRESDVNLALLPMHHTFGLVGTLMFLSLGATNVFCEGLRVQKALCEYKVSVLVGVPLILDSMKRLTEKTIKKDKLTFAFALLNVAYKVTRFLGLDLRRKIYKPLLDKFGGNLRLIISGAAPLSPETAMFFENKGIEVIQGYGLTETSPVIAAESYKYKKLGSVGKAMPSDDVKIVNIGEDGTGEIAVKGPNVMLGYYENEEMTASVMKDGYLFITGRIKNVIVLENGKKVYPEEVEFHIEKLEYVKEVMVFNKKEGKKDCVKATVVVDTEIMSVEEAKTLFEKDIKKINKQLAKYKQVQDYEVTDVEFDKTTTGKIKRH